MTESTLQPTQKHLIQLLAAVALLWLLSGLALYAVKDRGTFGDMFGAINALFSGLAFASLIYTIHLQRHELTLQRTELALTRKELEGQKLQMEEQNRVMRSQNFESTFFQLLRLLADTANGMEYQMKTKTTRGRECFEVYYQKFKEHYSAVEAGAPSKTISAIGDIAYSRFYREFEADLGHYFRTLYNLVKFVHRSDVADKRLYTNLIRAQLSSYELLMLFYNCLSTYGREKFKPLVEEYALLKTIPAERLINMDHLTSYNHTAYLSRVEG